MISKAIPRRGAFEAWRASARELLAANVPPEQVRWGDCAIQKTFFDEVISLPAATNVKLSVPKIFLELAQKVVAHNSDKSFSLPYKMLWRLQEEPHLLSNPADVDVQCFYAMAKNVSRDCHKMKAFVRFRELENTGGRRTFGAWFEPDHHIVELTGPFFANRFADMDWAISTPQAIAVFVDGQLTYAPPDGARYAVSDKTEDLWRTYYSNIFNPARLKVKAMQSEMPRKYWKNLPEGALIPQLIAGAAQRTQKMRKQMPSLPPAYMDKFKASTVEHPAAKSGKYASINELRAVATHCTRCPLHCHATQTVFGEGPAEARIMFVGEQPGDQEDIAGQPFIGPAGQIFDEALAAAGINRSDVYITNAVKHFKFTSCGKRRIHERPNRSEIQLCRWWLDKELDLIKPELVVAMGATALYAMTGQSEGIKNTRGRIQHPMNGPSILPTYHPSAILQNHAQAETIRRDFFGDIASISKTLTHHKYAT